MNILVAMVVEILNCNVSLLLCVLGCAARLPNTLTSQLGNHLSYVALVRL